jgi:glycerol-3-phosphate dehydrogenase
MGTTDNDYEGDIEHVRPSPEDVRYLLQSVNGYFRTTLRPRDLTGAYAGVRPLISTADAKKSVDISRKAELYETASGMITITGGKLTTWRRMAKLAVDRLTEREAREAPCRTHEIPLGEPAAVEELPRVEGVADEAYPHLAGRYGHAAVEVLELAAFRGELAQPIVAGNPDLLAEAAWAARRQQARSVDDVLLRRTRLGLLAARELTDRRAPATGRVARAMAPELGWDDRRAAAEVAAWLGVAEAEGIVPGDANGRASA